MGRSQDRVAVVTGAGEGIGAAIARRFALEGARVLLAEIDEALGRATTETLAAESGADTRFVRRQPHERLGVGARPPRRGLTRVIPRGARAPRRSC